MIEGVTVPTKRVGKNNFEVRVDGFGRMTDVDVAAYKAARPGRYRDEKISELEARIEALEHPGGQP